LKLGVSEPAAAGLRLYTELEGPTVVFHWQHHYKCRELGAVAHPREPAAATTQEEAPKGKTKVDPRCHSMAWLCMRS
jgi:hypothetical protein